MIFKSYLLKSIAILLLFGFFACSNKEELKVGIILPQEEGSSLEGYGFQILSGLEMAEEDINAEYELGKNMSDEAYKEKYGTDRVKKRIVLLKEYRESSNYEDTKVAVDSFKALIEEGVVAVIGPATSAGVIAVTKLANESRTIVLSPSATSPEINREGGDYIFRIYPSDTLEAQKLSYIIFQECFAHKLLVVRSKDSYGEGVALEVLRFARRQSDSIPNFVVKFDPDPNTADFPAVVDKIVETKPVAVFIGAYAESLIPLIREIKSRPELEKLYIWCSSSFLPNQMINALAPEQLTNVMFTMYPWFPKGSNEKVVAFAKRFEDKFGGTQPNIFAACGYDALKVISAALNDVNTDIPDLVQTAMNKVHYDKGLLGETDFDKRGDVTRIPRIYKIAEGEVVQLTQDDMRIIKTDILTRIDDDDEISVEPTEQ